MADDEQTVYAWDTAPQEMRAEAKRLSDRLKELEAKAGADAQRLAEVDRREKFNELKKLGGDALKDVELADIGDMIADQITPTILQAKALEKGQAREAALAKLATDAGFSTVDELKAFQVELAARNAATATGRSQNAAAATSGQGSKDPLKLPGEAAYAAYTEARTSGLPSDDARANAVNALIQATLAQADTT
jgi:hypothetical protein